MSDDPKPGEPLLDGAGQVVAGRQLRAMLDGAELPPQGFDGVPSEWMQEQVDDMAAGFADAWASEHAGARSIDMRGAPLTVEGIRLAMERIHRLFPPTSFQAVVNENGSIQYIVISPDPETETLDRALRYAATAPQVRNIDQTLPIRQSASGYLDDLEPPAPPDPGPGGLATHLSVATCAAGVAEYARQHPGSVIWVVCHWTRDAARISNELATVWGARRDVRAQRYCMIGRSRVEVEHWSAGPAPGRMIGAKIDRVHWLIDLSEPPCLEERRFSIELLQYMAISRASRLGVER